MFQEYRYGVISENLTFIPEGRKVSLPEITADPASEFYAAIAEEKGFFRKKSLKFWQNQAALYIEQVGKRKTIVGDLFLNRPQALQYKKRNGQFVVVSRSLKSGEYQKTTFDHRGPMSDCQMSVEEAIQEIVRSNASVIYSV